MCTVGGDSAPQGAAQPELLFDVHSGGGFVRLGQADHSDLPVQVNLNGALFLVCKSRSD